MTRYIGSRLLQAVVVILFAFTLSFFLLYLVPGDAAISRLGSESSLSAEDLAALRSELGLDLPWYVQYWNQLIAMLTGDLGVSLRTGRPVFEMITANLPNTIILAGLSLVVAVVLGIAIAVLATYTRLRWLRSALLALPVLGVSVPTFWLGVLLLAVFAFQLRWFPSYGSGSIDALVLPVMTLGTVCSANIAQVLATSMLDASNAPYAFTAFTKGASRWRVLLGHCLRNASIPMLTMIGLLTGALLTGSVITESVFSRAGIGRVILEGVQTSDLPVVQGVVLVCAVIFVGANLIVDLLYPVLDPRMRHQLIGGSR